MLLHYFFIYPIERCLKIKYDEKQKTTPISLKAALILEE